MFDPTIGQISNALNLVFCITGCMLRQKFRSENDIKGGTVDDFLCGGCCNFCSLCQIQRHMKQGGSASGVERMER